MTEPRMSLNKRKRLHKKKETLTDCLREILETKSQWETLSLKNRYALSSSLSVEQPLVRGRSEHRRNRDELQPPLPPRRASAPSPKKLTK